MREQQVVSPVHSDSYAMKMKPVKKNRRFRPMPAFGLETTESNFCIQFDTFGSPKISTKSPSKSGCSTPEFKSRDVSNAPSPVPDVDTMLTDYFSSPQHTHDQWSSEEDEAITAAHLLQRVHQSNTDQLVDMMSSSFMPSSPDSPSGRTFHQIPPCLPQNSSRPLPDMVAPKVYKPRLNAKKKECISCHTLDTPMWRDSADGERLCNACGIRWKKYGVSCGSCKYIPRKYERSSLRCRKCTGTLVVSPVSPMIE